MNEVCSKEEFAAFLYFLRDSIQKDPAMWTNKTIEDYLDALAGCVEGVEGFYSNRGEELPRNINWSVFADLLDCARLYD